MSTDLNKRQMLENAAKRASQKQPDEIHLIATPQHTGPKTFSTYPALEKA
jgi:hypothetical protein